MGVFLFVVLISAVIILTIKLHLMRKAAKEIAENFAARLTEDTNSLIYISSRDKIMCELATAISEQLAKLRDERRRFQQGDNELKEAVTNISHDLRTPLTAICGYLDLLEREEKSAAVSRYINMIENRTAALKSLTEELFRYSVTVSIDDIDGEKLSLNSVLEESLISFYATLEQRQIKPEISIPETAIERTLNRSALVRIFGNIINNAVKYSDGDLTVELSEDGTITFSNSAKELSTVEVGKLFDRFFTVENGRNSTGLGLSIAKLLTERMGGTISASCEYGRLYIRLKFPPELPEAVTK